MPSNLQTPQKWTADGLLDEIGTLHANMEDRSLAFILGAGASITSNIPAGAQLAYSWLEEIYRRLCLDQKNEKLETWAAKQLQMQDFKLSDAATHYSKIFELRFAADPKSGYAALEAVMEKAEPGLGYMVLAKILGETRHKVVVTTNFDNLVADALAIQASQHPLIVGHESLAGFVRPRLPRPLVAKIHRDLHLNPINDSHGVNTLENGWEVALTGLFQHYTPLVIGYGGNDGSLMGLLERLPKGHIPGRLFWCYREGAYPDDRVLKILAQHQGVLVAIAGFDEFMVQLAQKLFPGFDLSSIAKNIETLGKQRATHYQTLLEELAKKGTTNHSPIADRARQSMSEASHDDTQWWTWELRARAENDIEKRDAIYRQARNRLPENPELAGNYAIFLKNHRKDYDAAEAMYQAARALDPNDANITGNYAIFLADIRKDYDAAEAMFKAALALDPNDANITGNYASFLTDNRKDYDAAEAVYKIALALDPNDANITGNYASFLADIRKDYDVAEAMYKAALALDPNDANITGNYASFFADNRKDYDAAEAMYQAALALDPNDAEHTGNYASFLADIRKDYDAAEAMYQAALALDPSHANITGNYANFLKNHRKDYDTAETMYQAALTLDPNDARIAGNYAIFLADIRKNYDAAKATYKTALTLDPNNANSCANYAALLLIKGGSKLNEELLPLIQQVIALSNQQPSQALAEALLYGCLHSELSEEIPGKRLGQLKCLLKIGFERGSWDFAPIFDAVFPKINPDRQTLYQALGDAILNAERLNTLENFALWRETTESDPFEAS